MDRALPRNILYIVTRCCENTTVTEVFPWNEFLWICSICTFKLCHLYNRGWWWWYH